VTAIFQRHVASRGLFATAELLVKLAIINCHYFIPASGSLNFCTKIINSILVRHYYYLLFIDPELVFAAAVQRFEFIFCWVPCIFSSAPS